MSNGLTYLFVFLQLYSVKGSPPRMPESVSVTSVGANFLVQWRPPTVSYGPILHYQVVYNLLPEEDSVTMTTNGQTFVLIPVDEHPGRLYRIMVFAENADGLSRPSRPRYVRVTNGCGGNRYVKPETSINVISPFYPTRFEHNSLCSWILSTNASYVLSVTINDFNFSADSCINDFISLRDRSVNHGGKLCNISDGAFLSQGNETELSLHTGPNGWGRGFNVTVRSEVPLPKQPAYVKVIAMNNVITVSWSPPSNYKGDHITAYRVRYSVLPFTKRFVITLSTKTRRFPISTRGHEGQLYVVKVSAMHRFQEGPTSSPAYVRASCSREIVLAPGKDINITSPGYPQHYLPQVLCNWRITSGSGQPFYFRIAALDVEESLFCSSDYLSVSLWGNTRRCGTVSSPEEFTMVSGELVVKFLTDNHKENTGFIIEIKSETSSLLSPNMTERTTKSTEFRTSTDTVTL
ncbi:cubilin-like [Argopecten irradians]|uniref:cubilin-like n=1 Tax=Argopecten irradians TaxID=31199 RepID=UPI00371AB19C